MRKYNSTVVVIIAAVVLMAAAIASVLWYQYGIASRAQRQAFRTLQDSAAEQAILFKTLIDGRFQVLNMIAQNISFAGDKSQELLEADLKKLAQETDFKRLLFADADGAAYTSDGHRFDITSGVSLKRCLEGKRSLKKFASGTIDKIPIFVFSLPVKERGRNIGALMGVYDESLFIKALISKAYGAEAYSFICDSAGNIIVGSRHGDFLAQNSSLFDILKKTDIADTAKIRAVKENLENQRAGGISYEFGGKRRYAAYQPLNINDWTIFNVVPETAAKKAALDISTTGVFLVVVITLIAMAFAAIIIVIERRGYRRLLEKNERLKESEERFLLVLENTTLSVWDYDLRTKEIIQRGHSVKQHGFDIVVPNVPDSLIEGGFVHPDSAEAFRELYRRLFRGEKNAEGVFLVQTADRSGWWYEHIQYKTLFDQKGRPYRAIGMSMDVTEKRKLERSYQLELQYQQSLADDVYIMAVFDVSAKKREKLESKDKREYEWFTSASLSGFFAAEAKLVVSDRAVQEFFLLLDDEILKAMAAGAEHDIEREYLRRLPGGRDMWVRCTLHLLADPATEHLMLFVYMKDIDEQKRKEETLLRAAETDALTGLLNHAATMKHISDALADGSGVGIQALFAIDLDRFKQINDIIGHQAGDEALRSAGRAIQSAFRAEDVCGRTGGDEFLVLMRDAPSLEVILRKAKELQLALQIHCTGGQAGASFSGSVGVALWRQGDSLESLYARADKALYRAKNNGRNDYCIDTEGAEIKTDAKAAPAPGPEGCYSIQLQTLLQHMDGGVLIAELGEKIRALYVSPSFYTTTGLRPEDTADGGAGLLSMIHPDDAEEFENRLRQGARDGGHVDFSYRITNAKGSPAWRHLRALRIEYAGSRYPVMLTVVTDITEVKKTAALFDAVVKSSPAGIGVFELTPVLKPVLANNAMLRLAGLTQEEYLAKSGDEILEMAAPEDRPHLRAEIAAALQSGKLAEVTFRLAGGGKEAVPYVRASGVRIDGVSDHPLLLMLFSEAAGSK